jgi:RND family efflux transporter MFP subunit
MRKFVIIGAVVVAAAGAAVYFGLMSREQPAAAAGDPGGGRGPNRQNQGGGGFGGFGPGGFGGGGQPRPPITVELASITTGDISANLTVVGNLIGEQTVDVAPKTGGRLVSMSVQLGDRVRRGQVIAKIEDREIVEQVRQAEASLEVAKATIRQRDADLKVAEVNFERSKNLYARQLLAKQALDDAESRYLAGQAQVDLSKAQAMQTEARLEELRINLQNTSVVSPVDGFVGKRNVDPGAMVSQNSPVASVVEISRMRMIANVVEKDLRMVNVGDPAVVEVDAYPGEHFRGRIARVAPVLDPATRTASMEVEIPNSDTRLKPGMYARVSLQVEDRKGVLLAPKAAVIDFEGKRGVWVADGNKPRFVAVSLGIEDPQRIEITGGLKRGDQIVVAGAATLRASDTIVVAGQSGPGSDGPSGPGRGGMGGRGMRGGDSAARGSQGGQRPEGTTGGQRPPGQRPPG